MFTDLVNSVDLQSRVGTNEYAKILQRHDALLKEAIAGSSGQILKHTGDGFVVRFDMSSEAVRAALRFQLGIGREDWKGHDVQARIGLHQGEVLEVDDEIDATSPMTVGMAVNLAARVMDLALGRQVLMTRPVYENARHYVHEYPLFDDEAAPELKWVAHGYYNFKGSEEPMEIFEAGGEELAPLEAPESGEKARKLKIALTKPPIAVKPLSQSSVFLSYARLDDVPLAVGQMGWVSQLHRALEVRLGQLTGETVSVWKTVNASDERSPQDQSLPEKKEMEKIRAVVPVISPPYLKSDSCLKELEFLADFVSDQTKRLVRVNRRPIRSESNFPAALERVASFDFFREDEKGNLLEFDEFLTEESRRGFLHRVYDLAHEISRTFQPGSVSPRKEQSVFLAITTSDLLSERDQIRRELLERGYRVYPEDPLPYEAKDFRRCVDRDLRKVDVAIHLVGGRYGMIPEGSDRSVVELQCQLSAERTEEDALQRLVWAPRGLEFEEERQRDFFDALASGSYGMEHTEILRGSLQELKQISLGKLSRDRAAQPALEALPPNANKMVYLICASEDEGAIEPLEDYLFNAGFEVKIPSYDGDPKNFDQIHQETLKLCDAALVYFGSASAQWVEMKLMDLVKAPGFGRVKPFLGQAVYVAPPTTRRKQRFRSRTAMVIRESNGFNERDLDPFVEALTGDAS